MAKLFAPVDLSKGPIVPGVVAFAVPLLVSSVAQQLYSTVDLLFVGNVLGTHAAAALGVSMLLVTCIVGLLSGLTVGANVVIAQLFGAGDMAGAARCASTVVVAAVVGGAAFAVFGVLFAPAYLQLMDAPGEIIHDALIYLRFYAVALVPVVLYNAAAGVARALGDSATPMLAQLLGGFANIAVNWVFLCVFGFGIAGVAAATLFSNGLAAWLVFRTLRARSRADAGCIPDLTLGLGALRSFDTVLLARVLRIGIPVGLQSFVITLSNVFVQHQIDLLGVEAIAAFTAYFKVELPIYYAIVAVGQATTTFVAQSHGAGDHDRVRRGSRVCQVLGIAVAVVLSAVMLLVGKWAFWLFNQDQAIIDLGLRIIGITFPFYFLYAILEVQADAIRGLGHSTLPALVILANICVLRTILVFALTAESVTIGAIAITYPITWFTTALCMVGLRAWIDKAHGHRA